MTGEKFQPAILMAKKTASPFVGAAVAIILTLVGFAGDSPIVRIVAVMAMSLLGWPTGAAFADWIIQKGIVRNWSRFHWQ